MQQSQNIWSPEFNYVQILISMTKKGASDNILVILAAILTTLKTNTCIPMITDDILT
jgi:hypothetical protein